MFINPRLQMYKDAMNAAEDMQNIASINLSNANTLGYKKLTGAFGPSCACDDGFDNYLLNGEKPSLQFNVTRDNSKGKEISLNGQELEGSNVDASEELKNIVEAANMTRSILAGLQIENRLNQEIMNLGR